VRNFPIPTALFQEDVSVRTIRLYELPTLPPFEYNRPSHKMAGLEGTLRVRHPPGLRSLSEILLAGVSRIPVPSQGPEIRAPVYLLFLLALRWSGTTCPSYLPTYVHYGASSLLEHTGASPGPLLCCSGLSSPAVAVFLLKFVGSFLLALLGCIWTL